MQYEYRLPYIQTNKTSNKQSKLPAYMHKHYKQSKVIMHCEFKLAGICFKKQTEYCTIYQILTMKWFKNYKQNNFIIQKILCKHTFMYINEAMTAMRVRIYSRNTLCQVIIGFFNRFIQVLQSDSSCATKHKEGLLLSVLAYIIIAYIDNKTALQTITIWCMISNLHLAVTENINIHSYPRRCHYLNRLPIKYLEIGQDIKNKLVWYGYHNSCYD